MRKFRTILAIVNAQQDLTTHISARYVGLSVSASLFYMDPQPSSWPFKGGLDIPLKYKLRNNCLSSGSCLQPFLFQPASFFVAAFPA